MKSKFFFLALVGIFLISFISAAAVQINPSIDTGITIIYPKYESIEINTGFNLSIHVTNTTDAGILTSPICILQLQGSEGLVLIDDFNFTQINNHYNAYLSPGNFTKLGTYNLLIYCEDGSGIKGFASESLLVTNTGEQQTTAEAIGSFSYLALMVFLTCLFLFVGFKLSESENLWVLGIFFMFISLLFLVYNTWLGYEYQLKYVGAAASTAVPEILFYIFLGLLVCGLLVCGLLLFRKLPEFVSWIKVNFKGENEDGWDNDKFK